MDVLVAIRVIYSLCAGALVFFLSWIQISVECLHQKVDAIHRLSHRSTLLASLFYGTGWLLSSRTDRIVLTLAELMQDLCTIVLTCGLIALSFLLLKSLYAAQAISFPPVARYRFWLFVLFLVLACLLLDILSGVLDELWPRALVFLLIAVSAASSQSVLWYRWRFLNNMAATVRAINKAENPAMRRFYKFMMIASALTIVGAITCLLYGLFVVVHFPHESPVNRIDDHKAKVAMLCGSLQQSFCLFLGVWYGWMSLSPLTSNPTVPQPEPPLLSPTRGIDPAGGGAPPQAPRLHYGNFYPAVSYEASHTQQPLLTSADVDEDDSEEETVESMNPNFMFTPASYKRVEM